MKLNISTQAKQDIEPMQEVYTYRWDRIVIAIVGILLLAGLIVAGISRFGGNRADRDAADNAATALGQSSHFTTAPAPAPAPAPKVSTPAQPPALAKEDTAEPPAVPEVSDDMREPPHAAGAGSDAPASPTPLPHTATTSPKPAAKPTTAPPAPIPAPPTRQQAASAGLFSHSDTTIASSDIKRFVLAAAVRDKEPVGTLDDITLNRDNTATLYAYSEVVNRKDDTLRYVWTLNGRKVAEVKVPVWSNRWRSYSSKFVTENNKGEWRVELRDKGGKILASSDFSY